MRKRLLAAETALISGLTLVCGLLGVANAVDAQGLIFDWGGEDKTATSGKGHVKFNGGGKPGDIIVSFGDRKLYFFTAPGEADTYLVATPRDQSRWEGVTSVTQKRENPSWTPTPHMLQENPKLPRWVPGGHPMNPLGIRALYLGSSDYRIHGTDAPWTIGTPVSKGCVRMFNKDVVELYPKVKVGTKVIVTWQKFDTRTMTMAGLPNKGITELEPTKETVQNGKPTLTSYVQDGNATPQRAKYHKPSDEDDNDVVNSKSDEKAEKTADKAKTAAIEPDEFIVPKKRKSRASANEGTSGEVKEHSEAPAAVADPAPVPRTVRPTRAARLKSAVKSQSTAEQDAPVSSSKSTKRQDQASLGVAERALAAAERAADAAERAAAAAERAVAASQQRGGVSLPASSGEVTAH